MIDATFTQAADITVADVRHPTNPALRATAVLPVLPDFRCWSNQYVQMQFDLDPAFVNSNSKDCQSEVSMMWREVASSM